MNINLFFTLFIQCVLLQESTIRQLTVKYLAASIEFSFYSKNRFTNIPQTVCHIDEYGIKNQPR